MVGSRKVRDDARRGQIDALTQFAVANDDLERLEALIGAFNIFEALGVARQELRHSDFLAFLLDPRQPHGLGDRFLKRFLQFALSESFEQGALTPVEVEMLSLEKMVPYRERQNIDILLLDPVNRVAVIIENKIGSGEHSGQLQRYLDQIKRQYPHWRVIPIFLSAAGSEPTDARYHAVEYGAVADIVANLAEIRRSGLETDVYGLLHHYVRLLRRYVVEDSEIADLCRQIYARHQRAIDLIMEHRPGETEVLKEYLRDLVNATGGLIENDDPRSGLRFIPEEWDIPALRHADGWTASKRILLFEFDLRTKRLGLTLVIGPGEPSLRQRIIDAARAAGPPFKVPAKTRPLWTRIYSVPVLTERDFANSPLDARQDRIRQFWGEFTSSTLPAMAASLQLPGSATIPDEPTLLTPSSVSPE